MSYQNIGINRYKEIDAELLNDQYYDYELYNGQVLSNYLSDEMLIADFSCPYIVDGDKIESKASWNQAKNDGVELEDIGLTGMDNGFIHFRKDRISNEEFLKLFTESKFDIESGKTNLFLTRVTGNTLEFDYPMEIKQESESDCYISFNGGFYQGFYALDGFNYTALPNGPDIEWNLCFKLRPRSDYNTNGHIINDLHPENKGIFFYIGTRAENKFWELYKKDVDRVDALKKIPDDNNYTNAEICGEETDLNLNENTVVNQEFLQDEVPEVPEDYFADDYAMSGTSGTCIYEKNEEEGQNDCGDFKPTINDFYSSNYNTKFSCCSGLNQSAKPEEHCTNDYQEPCVCDDYFKDGYYNQECADGDKAIDSEYVKKDAVIDESKIEDSFGHELLKKGYYEIKTDNKFLIFDRTKNGKTVDTWEEGTIVTLTGRQDWENENLFPIMNRTETGYTVENIENHREANSRPYNLFNDIYRNAFCLRITDDGRVGYRYMDLDCDSEQRYRIEEEYSKSGIVKTNDWNNIVVKISILNPTSENCDPYKGNRRMKIYFYVNGFLVLVSKELNEFDFRRLNDVYQKQEGVPYSISLGGGTQGLLETILPNYYYWSNYLLPIEKHFCGSFIGDIQYFKIFNGYCNFSTIQAISK